MFTTSQFGKKKRPNAKTANPSNPKTAKRLASRRTKLLSKLWKPLARPPQMATATIFKKNSFAHRQKSSKKHLGDFFILFNPTF